MEFNLSDVEVRVLGCLVEKELATPDYYPLTLNSLTTACNQKSNRDPVMNLEEVEVVQALDSLRRRRLAMQSAEGGRVPKYQHALASTLHLDPAELAVLAELLLRGPQTLGELRGRADRMHSFADIAAVEEVLRELSEREPPLVVQLPRQPGRKEPRIAHLLSGEPAQADAPSPPPEPARLRVQAGDERMAELESEVARLRTEIEDLRREFTQFKKDFE